MNCLYSSGGKILKNGGVTVQNVYEFTIVVTVDSTHRPVEFYLLHAGIADYFHHGGQQYQNFGLQPTK